MKIEVAVVYNERKATENKIKDVLEKYEILSSY